MERRIFLQNMGWMGVFPSLGSAFRGQLILGAPQTNTIGGLLPVALIGDAFNLTFACRDLNGHTYRILTQNMSLRLPGNQGWMANFVLPPDADLAAMVEQFKPGGDPKSLNKLAILFGAVGHTALHRELWTLYEKYESDRAEMIGYHDAHCIREMAGMTAVDQLNQSDLKKMLLALNPRSLERIHTLIADVDDGAGWLHKMVAWRDAYHHRVAKYAEIMMAPDDVKWQMYISGPGLYNAGDPIVKLANRFRKAEPVRDRDVRQALRENAGSIYGRSLQKAVLDMLELDKIITEKCDN